MNHAKAKILIVEDEESIRQGLTDVFVFHGYETEAVANGDEGLRRALSGVHHLVILDVMLPDRDGFSVCDEIRKRDRTLPIIMLTAKSDEEDIIRGLKLGADDYIPKPFSIRELVARAEAVLRRSQKLVAENRLISICGMQLDPSNLTLNQGESMIELTRRETDILRYLEKNNDRPVSRQELLKEVWGYGNTQMDTRTVDIHMAKLRRKLGDDADEPTLILTIRGEGYKLGVPRP